MKKHYYKQFSSHNLCISIDENLTSNFTSLFESLNENLVYCCAALACASLVDSPSSNRLLSVGVACGHSHYLGPNMLSAVICNTYMYIRQFQTPN